MALYNRINRSFAARFTIFVLLITVAVFLVTFFFSFRYSFRTIEEEGTKNAYNLLDKINLEIEKRMLQMEKIPDNFKRLVEDNQLSHEEMYTITADIIRNNPEVSGCVIAFEPDYFPEEGRYFAPSTFRIGDSIATQQLGSYDYDYFTMDWYQIPKLIGQNHWSQPYYDEGGGKIIMSTYSSLIHNKKGEMIGIFTVDVDLSWLTEVLVDIKPYPSAYSYVIGDGGTYILHQKKELIFCETIFSYALSLQNNDIAALGQQMTDGKRGDTHFRFKGKEMYTFYTPIPALDWSVALVCPREEMLAGLIQNNRILILIAFVGLVLICILTARAIKRLSRPISQFSDSAKSIAHGNFNTELPVIKTNDEMKELRDAFSYLQEELVNYINSLQSATSAKERIESELRIARDIQMGMIPKTFPAFTNRKEIDIYAMLRPAKEVGGDLYDFFIDGDRLFFTIGDVSGKGVPASLLMAVTRSLFRVVSNYLDSTAKILEAINRSISENNESNMFVTQFVGILDLKTGDLRFCNGGHNPIVLMHDQEVAFLSEKPNLAVGLFDGFPFEEQNIKIDPGSTLFLYTDGLTEAENTDKALYGDDRLISTLKTYNEKATETDDAKALVEYVLEDVHAHVREAEQSDDLTIFAVRFCKL